MIGFWVMLYFICMFTTAVVMFRFGDMDFDYDAPEVCLAAVFWPLTIIFGIGYGIFWLANFIARKL